MAEIPVSTLDGRQQKLVENARVALERGNLDYTVEACAQVLKAAPACVAVRRLQRVAQLRQFQAKNRFMAKAMGGLTATPFLFGGKKNPTQAFENAEKLLAVDPTNVAALKNLGEAARELEWPETAVFAFEAARELQPADREILLAVGEAWLAAGRPAEALRAADAILKTRPVDAEAQKLMRQASIAQTMTKGNWETAATFREKLKDEAQAVSLEQAAKVVTSAEMTQRLLDEARARVEAEPGNLNHYRTLVNGCRQLGRTDEALRWVRRAREQRGAAADVSLEKQESELQVQLLEAGLKAAETALAAAPEDRGAQQRREQLRGELAAFRLAEAQRTVERYPNDFAARQALGALLLESGKTDLAIAQFQQAQKNPQVRVAALVGLGRAFKAKKLFDLAVAQFTTAKRELGVMDETKKDVIYELGSCLEAMGNAEAAIAEFKAVYSEDIGFRDVAEKINAYYARG